MAEMTTEQLRQWYKEQFAPVMWNEARIDVNCAEDLGRVRCFFVTARDAKDPMAFEGVLHYAYIPHDGKDYTVQPENGVETDEWCLQNQKTERTDEELRELYEMVRAGMVLINKPGKGEFHQVRVNENGEVTLSGPSNKKPGPDELQAEEMPIPPAPPGPEPKEPKLPAEMEKPGFFSRLGYYLGMHTKYTDYLENQRQIENFPEVHHGWALKYAGWQERTERYNAGMVEYENQMVIYRERCVTNYESIFNGVMSSVEAVVGLDFESEEELGQYLEGKDNTRKFWESRHKGTVGYQQESIENQVDSIERCMDTVEDLLGPTPRECEWLMEKGTYSGKKDYDPEPYELPQNSKLSKREAALVAFAALVDPDVGGNFRPMKGVTKEELASINYTHVLNDIFVMGRSNARPHFPILGMAREKAQEVIAAYNSGNAEPLGKMLGTSLREHCIQTSSFTLDTMGMNGNVMTREMLKLLENDPALMAASGLTDEELERARGAVALLEVKEKGLKARAEMLRAQREGISISDERRAELLTDVLQAVVVNAKLEENNRVYEDSEEYMERVGQANMVSITASMEKDNAQKDPNMTEEEKAEKEEASRAATGLANVANNYRPVCDIQKQLAGKQDPLPALREAIRQTELFQTLQKKDIRALAEDMSDSKKFAKAVINGMQHPQQDVAEDSHQKQKNAVQKGGM